MVGSSLMGLLPGDCFQLRDLVYGLMLPSGNDAALAIARHITGSDAAFVDAMNALLARLELKDSHFVNPHGLDAKGHVASAHDLALLANYAMTLPFFEQVVSARQWTARGSRVIALPNVNGFLSGYAGADGVKTGFTDGAGRTLVASATRNGKRVFVALLNAPNRYEDAGKLMDWAFQPPN
jgi:D-alanyl-D-alanine carboxypeptidase